MQDGGSYDVRAENRYKYCNYLIFKLNQLADNTYTSGMGQARDRGGCLLHRGRDRGPSTRASRRTSQMKRRLKIMR